MILSLILTSAVTNAPSPPAPTEQYGYRNDSKYVAEVLRIGEGHRTVITFDIPHFHSSHCKVIESSGSAFLDKEACTRIAGQGWIGHVRPNLAPDGTILPTFGLKLTFHWTL